MFGSLMRFGDEDDDIFGAHMQNMNQMMNSMNSMFANPFGMMGGMGGFGAPPGFGGGGFMPMMPQMPDMNQMMSQMQNNGNCHSYSSSTVMSMTNGPDGRPQVYQASSSTRSAPGGIKETKKAVCDSRTGVKKLAIGHAIGDKAHIIEREQNLRSGEQEERQDFINLDEEESESFNKEWQQKARQAQLLQHSIDYPQHSSRGQEPQLALPDCNTSRQGNSRPIHSSRHHATAPHPYHNASRHHQPQLAIQASSPQASRKRDHNGADRKQARKPECNTTTAHNETEARRPECNTTTPAPEPRPSGQYEAQTCSENKQSSGQYERQNSGPYETQNLGQERQNSGQHERQTHPQSRQTGPAEYERQTMAEHRQAYERQVAAEYQRQMSAQYERQSSGEYQGDSRPRSGQ